jgi:hypothetical protein
VSVFATPESFGFSLPWFGVGHFRYGVRSPARVARDRGFAGMAVQA